jgi:hypothetical protein
MQYMTPERSTLTYEMPLAEVVTDFFDELKSRSKGYASMEYQPLDYRVEDLVKLDVKINGELAEPLATICHRCVALERVCMGSVCLPRTGLRCAWDHCACPGVVRGVHMLFVLPCSYWSQTSATRMMRIPQSMACARYSSASDECLHAPACTA